MIALSIVCASACLALVVAEARQHAGARIAAKLVASLAFLGAGLVAPGGWDAYRAWLVAGLALGVVGDAALLGRGNRAFLAGLGAFLCGHAAYVVAFAQLDTPARWFGDAGATAALPVVVAAIALVLLWPRLGAMRAPVIVYIAAIVAMVIGALASHERRVIAGAALFFASDLAVARNKFVAPTFSNKAWGLPAYYAGQLWLAWSLAG